MPFTFLPHQAPVVPLKLLRPRWFDGAALVIGSMAPDFEKFIYGDIRGRYAHTLAGQFTYCLPLSLLVYLLLTRVAARALAAYAPDLGAFRLRDYFRAMVERPSTRWLVVVTSALVGSVSHVMLDGFTHGDRRVVAIFPALAPSDMVVAGRHLPRFFLLQAGASVIGAAVTVGLMYVIGSRRLALAWAGLPREEPRRAASPRAARRFWAAVLALTVCFSGASALYSTLHGNGWRSRRDFVQLLAFRLPLAGTAAVCVAALADGRLRRMSARRAARDRGGEPVAPSRRTDRHSRSIAS